ncbi:hypothetical protein FHU38_001810 [Saccharomonospora amisosensis]|uniref:Uncharacterized protein n=1 Tax=Saccharomonospora amisosensis TaxID=1128677 RepID=A0A7X5UNU7_9PSEU|nr:hypothetical protein [Saccharomonospora amisosensis]NIJ11466.1 hypothetical protein [Saccharomonospora amisosensis]
MRSSVNITNYSGAAGPAVLGAHLGRVTRAADRVGQHVVAVSAGPWAEDTVDALGIAATALGGQP